jgi:hypothetical protein
MSGMGRKTDRRLSGRPVAIADIAGLPPFPKRMIDRERKTVLETHRW